MDDIYQDNFYQRRYRLNLIQYYALFDPNGDQGVIQGLRYYPRDVNTVIPNNPELDSKINYYKPFSNPRVVLPRPRYKKRISNKNKDPNMINNYQNDNMNTLNQKNFMDNENIHHNNEMENNKDNNEIYRTFRRSYSNEKEEKIVN